MEPKSILEFYKSVDIDVCEEMPLSSTRMSKLYALYPTNPCMAWDFGRAGYSSSMVFSYSRFRIAIREPENRHTTK